MKLKTAIAYTVILIAAVVISDQVFYKMILAPNLDKFNSVPVLHWTLVYSPIAVAMILIGVNIKSTGELFTVSIITSLVKSIYSAGAANLNQPGHVKALATEAPLIFWTLGVILATILHLIVYAVIWKSAERFRSRKSTA